MQDNKTYTAFIEHVKQINALGQAAGLLSWDQEVMMPPDGAEARAEQMAALEAVSHTLRTSAQLGDWLDALEDTELDEPSGRNVVLMRRSYDRSVKVPTDLAQELARVTATAQGVWAKARQASRFQDFAPLLTQIINLKREEAACIAQDGQSHYDALLNDFEPGMDVATLDPLLETLRPRLSQLRSQIATKQQGFKDPWPKLKGTFDTNVQMAISRHLADILGYNWSAGRLDLSVHPFSSGTGGDSRITTRVDESEPFGCIYSTVHELGHALYEQGVPQAHMLEPVGQHASMGVHESQSRLWENQIGRSRAFCTYLYPHIMAAFPECGISDAEDFYRAVNGVETDFIRTEADEVHYNLHVLLRFELERDLIGGALEVDDLEQEWNRRFQRDFGLAVPDAAHGVLQDVHWSVGLFGYFPTYSLGNIYAGQLFDALNEDVADLDGCLRKGETSEVLSWLRDKVHRHGSLLPPDELMRQASGQPVSAEPLLAYLEGKYTELFNLT